MKEINIVESMLLEEKRAKVAQLIQTARVQKGLTQEELASIVGCSRHTILRIEACKYSLNADQLYMILEALELTLKINDEKI